MNDMLGAQLDYVTIFAQHQICRSTTLCSHSLLHNLAIYSFFHFHP